MSGSVAVDRLTIE